MRLFIISIICLVATPLYGADITLEFDHSPVKEVVSYSIFVDSELFATADLADVIPETGYYRMVKVGEISYDVLISFQVIAKFTDGTENPISNAVSGTVPRPPEPEEPVNLRRVIIRDGDTETILTSG